MKRSLASRLSTIYAVLLGLTVLIVILASSLALVIQLFGFSRDIIVAKHEEARILFDQFEREGLSFRQAAPQIVNALEGIGLRVTVFDNKGNYVAGDKALRPKILGKVLAAGGMSHFIPPTAAAPRDRMFATHGGSGNVVFFEQYHRALTGQSAAPAGGLPPPAPEDPTRFEPIGLTMVDGGYVAFAPSLALVLVSLVPYWRIVLTIAVAAMLLSWFVGRFFAAQLLEPIKEVSESLRSLAGGDYTQRRFMMAGGDEVASLTAAYNDAAASVAAAMNDRRRAEERMRQFAADASHELRTPLTVIGGYIDVLRRGAVEEPKIARQILSTMSLEKEHMRGLIDRLMRLARLDSEAPPHVESIDVAEFLRSQCEAARRLDDRCTIDYSVDGVTTIAADRGELGEAMWNLIENALKYAPDAPIHLRAARADGRTVITVRDEGPGMSESERVHAFERFYRGDQRGEIAGSGLGLAIAQRAVERAGGSISIDSAPEHGTTVTITL
jgi:two-component system OmpR family sensor kinase